MIRRLTFASVCIAIATVLVVSIECGSMPVRHSRHFRHPLSYRPSEQSLANPYLEDRPPPPPHQQIPRYTDNDGVPTRGVTNSRTGPERGQILHRPKSSERKRYPKSQGSQSQQSQSMSDGGPIILNRGKGVKYVPLPGSSQSSSGYQGNQQEQSNRPSVYVISGGNEEEENEGIMGSMQTYFKSFRGRIKSAMQGIIGQDGDDRKLS